MNKTERSYTQLDSRKQVAAFWDRIATTHKGSSTSTKMSNTSSEAFHALNHVLNARNSIVDLTSPVVSCMKRRFESEH